MSDYLWNKTGEPDPAVEYLESILGELGYKARVLELPPETGKPSRRRSSLLRLLAAAVVLLGVATWLVLSHVPKTSPPAGVAFKPSSSALSIEPGSGVGVKDEISIPGNVDKPNDRGQEKIAALKTGHAGHPRWERRRLAQDTTAEIHRAKASSKVAFKGRHRSSFPLEMAEARKAKKQLIQALRVVSASLSYVQRKAPGITSMGANLDQRN